ncbi:iron ABC transporter permease [Iamia sp. SCSIO 61187]|uniref:ABC transporter permease n=1 Tax=Iamia sp. SCSIO 61187 TaxID=2722752 RepID=UPI001C630813|nr:iron ABC transporter permease [Iamia sp. SCSIO 61187]QYG92009.1 iron ABC transporter permease [Iamia sp. SCSIO 61187]
MALAETLPEVPSSAAPGRPPDGPRVGGWTVVGGLVALLVVGPLVALPASFLGGGDPIARSLLPDALRTSILLGLGVGLGTLVVGGGLAVLVSFWDFPGRRVLDWALVLPMAMPGYVLTFVLLAQYGRGNALQSNLLGNGLDIPGLRTSGGAIAILTGVLYPYVYVLGRSAFLGQSRQALEAARGMGRSYGQAVRQVALPLARPALAAGAALAIMEALADFGTVDLLGVQALPNAIYRVWNGAFDRDAALQLATVLVGLALTMVTIERALRGRARYHQALGRGDAVVPRRLHGVRGAVAAVPGFALLATVFALPVVQLAAWSVETLDAGETTGDMWAATRHTLLLGGVTVLVAVSTATLVAYGKRGSRSRAGGLLARLATVGYAVPGTVVAVAVYGPLVWFDRRVVDLAESAGRDVGLLVTGTILGLVLAYTVRFHALAFFSIEARMGRISTDLDDAARALGADRARVLADVHLPLLRPGLLTAALLVLVEVMKELPATALLRPLGRDTLAITVYEATKDSRLDAAALPALLIVVAGLVPVILLVRSMRTDGAASP